MANEIIVPRLGWSMDEGTFGEWLKQDGEFVQAGDMLFVLEGDKALQEIESFDSGILHVPSDAPKPGDTVTVGQRLGLLLSEGEAPPSRPLHDSHGHVAAAPSRRADIATAASTSPSKPKRVAGPAARKLARELGIDLDTVATPDPTGRVLTDDIRQSANQSRSPGKSTRTVASPRARRTARELGIDWTSVTGTGRNGRIRERDVLAARRISSATGTRRPASRIRRTIAQRVVASVQQTAPVTLTTKVDATQLVSLRQQLKSGSSKAVPTYNDMLVKLVAATLPQCPELNASWIDDAMDFNEEINIAIAVDTNRGLLAPVLDDVPAMTLAQVAAESRRLVDQARSGQLSEKQLEGGTFTISNLGMFGIDYFTPIINLPQTAILGVGRIGDEPVVADGELAAGKTLALSLTFDHRIIDGAPAARWLQQLADSIQQASPGSVGAD